VHRETCEAAFQDALGDAIERLVRAIPHGVLIFLPSYTLFATLRRRWGETRRWDTIGGAKRLFCEPQSATQREFSAMLSDYYAAAETPIGAVLFAVFRGRCSEGMDFADGRARAVIGVGLPLPNLKSGLIEAKMAYNQARVSGDRLSGNAWYTLQAWRALNQALGRCIRHRTDHGALILIDARFAERNGLASLSRWVRERMAPTGSVDALEARLVQFFESQ
jgi:Rad3-related DNA helicase